MMPVELRTARTVLDLPRETDVDAITAYCQDPLFERYLTIPWPYRRHHAEGWVAGIPAQWRGDQECTWAIRDPADATFLGVIGLTLARDDRPGGTIGFWLGAPFRGRGLLPEAGAAVLDWAFSTAAVDLVRWEAVVPNRSSLAVARKLGFRYTGERAADIEGRDGDRPTSWHAELGANDDRGPKPGWPE